MVTLICPRGTTISIQVAQYGTSASQSSCSSELTEYQPVAVEVVGDTSCIWPNTLQVIKICIFNKDDFFMTSLIQSADIFIKRTNYALVA